MTMIVDFADGFTSGSSPNLIGLGNEEYPILNNQSVLADFVGLDFNGYSSVSGMLEIERFSDFESFRQVADIVFSQDAVTAVWSFDLGAWRGDDLITETIVDPKNVVLSITPIGQVQYQSGEMDDDGYQGKLKLTLNRINT